MPGPLACVLSYGLMCAPGEVVEVPPAVALEPASDSGTGAAGEPTAPKGAASILLAQVQSFYDGTSDLSAQFKQTYVHPVYGTKKESSGNLRVKKPGKMVWDYDASDAADVWVDGKKVWVVEQDTRQVIHKDVGTSDFAGAEKFLFGGRQLLDDFFVKMAPEALNKRYGKSGRETVLLKPKKKNPHYSQLLLVVDPSGRVDAFVVLNNDKSTNKFELDGLDRNTGLPATDFKFKKPKGFVQIEG